MQNFERWGSAPRPPNQPHPIANFWLRAYSKVRNYDILKSLSIETFLFRTERSQLRCFRHVSSRMSQQRLPNGYEQTR